MLLFIAMLALLSLAVSGLPTTNTTGVEGGNATDVNVLFNENPLCWWGGTDMKEQPGECRCFHDGAGVHREYMIKAINKACLEWSGGIGWTSYYYYTPPEVPGVFSIATTLQVQHHDGCMGPLPVSRQYCWDSLCAELDACNTEGVLGKKGGYKKRDCLSWVLDPNPDIHWPYYGLLE